MILWTQQDGSVLATPQPAHAVLAGQLMRALAEPPAPLEPVINAAAQHDCAWMEWERAPEFDAATGLPRHFNALSGAEHVPMWEQGVRDALANWGLWAGLLILRHGSHIYRLGILGNRMAPSGESLAAMEGYMAREKEWSAELMAKLGVEEAQVTANQRKIAMVDSIALGLCWGQERFDCNGTTLIRTSARTATLEPWPLAVPRITLETETLHLPGPFPDAGAMQAGITAAPRERLAFELEAA
jgi:hypothetical protein